MTFPVRLRQNAFLIEAIDTLRRHQHKLTVHGWTIFDRLSRCGIWAGRVKRGAPIRDWCGLACCPRCGKKIKEKWAEEACGRMEGYPRPHMSCASINGRSVPDREVLREIERLTKLLKRTCRVRSLRFHGHVELALESNGLSRPHLHGMLVHGGRSREDTRKVLKGVFTEAYAVCLQEIDERRGGTLGWFSYSSDARVNAPKRIRTMTSDTIVRYINVIGLIPVEKFSRLCRVKIGISKQRGVENDPVWKEMKFRALVERVRRSRERALEYLGMV